MPPDDNRRTLATAAREQWQPRPLDPPIVEAELENLDALERSTEVIRYSILSTEYWLSPKGTLREWARFNLKILAVLGIPGLLIVPVVTCLLTEFVTWSALLVEIATNLAVLPSALLLAVLLFSALAFVIRKLFTR